MSESKKIAVVGSADTILPFRSIGAVPYDVDTSSELLETLKKITQEGTFGIIFVEESLAATVLEDITMINDQYRGIAITTIPGTTDKGGVALQRLSSQVTRAIGIDIFAQKGGN